jgi:hypothetical protein
MAEIYYLNQPTRDYMKLARKNILKTYELVRQGHEKAAYRCANRAVEAYDMAMQKSREPGLCFSFKTFFSRHSHTGDAA